MLARLDARNQEFVRRLEATAEADAEVATVIGRSFDDMRQASDDIRRETDRIYELLKKPPSERFAQDVGDLDGDVASFLNYALGNDGFSAQAGLWFNPPVWVLHRERGVGVHEVSERIAEIPYAFRAIGKLDAGATILDVGAAESTVALSLASLGYEVTALDPRPYPLSHPRLRSVEGRVEDWDTPDTFDAVICLSTIEHVGLPAYGQEPQPGADLAAMRRIHELSRPGAVLVLTVPFGTFSADDFQRTYDREHLDELLGGWEITDFALARRASSTCWQVDGVADEDVAENGERVALVTAIRSS